MMTTPPKQEKKTVVGKNTMIFYLFKDKVSGTNQPGTLPPCICRNRVFGPVAVMTRSPHLDIEISDDNRTMMTH